MVFHFVLMESHANILSIKIMFKIKRFSQLTSTNYCTKNFKTKMNIKAKLTKSISLYIVVSIFIVKRPIVSLSQFQQTQIGMTCSQRIYY